MDPFVPDPKTQDGGFSHTGVFGSLQVRWGKQPNGTPWLMVGSETGPGHAYVRGAAQIKLLRMALDEAEGK